MSARSVPAYGPAMKLPSSRTRIPSSAAVGTDDLVVEAEQLVGDVLPVDELSEVADLRTAADDDEPRFGVALLQLRVCAHEVCRALARLQAADEQEVGLPVAVLGERLRAREEVDVDAVGDDAVVAREVGRDEMPRRARHGDAAIELVHVPLRDRPERPVAEREAAERVERRDLRARLA